MTITRVGTNEKYANGWDAIFGGRKTAKSSRSVATGTAAPKAKSAKKVAKAVSAKTAAKKVAKKATAKPVAKKAAKKGR